MSEQPFDVVVPVKPLDRAKSRLAGPRAQLMRAFALDALTACVATPRVRTTYVLTDDVDLVRDAVAVGCVPLADRGEGRLNLALSRAVATLPAGAGAAALLGDLPCLLTADLDAALAVVGTRGAVVADAAGTGSTLLAVPDPTRFRPRFGAGSFRAHLDAGYEELGLGVASLRRDVDTAEDLADAVTLGVGAHTRAVLETHDGR